jgi:hypothetical protein
MPSVPVELEFELRQEWQPSHDLRVDDGPLRNKRPAEAELVHQRRRSRRARLVLVSGGARRIFACLLVLRTFRLLLRPNLSLLLQPHPGKGLPHIGCGAMRVLKRRVQDRFQGAPSSFCCQRALKKADCPLSRASLRKGIRYFLLFLLF